MIRRRRRGAWTLVEVLVALAVAAVLLGIAIEFFASGQRQSLDLAFRLHALRSAHILRAHLAADLASALAAASWETAIPPSHRFCFHRMRAGRSEGLHGTALDARMRRQREEVRYAFDPKGHRVVRTCGGKRSVIKAGRFLDVTFAYRSCLGSDGRGDAVILKVVSVPERCLRAGGAVGPETPRVEQTFMLPGSQSTLWSTYDEWAF